MARQPALVVALLGAESTGKTTLARALAEALSRETGEDATWVPESLRDWCEAAGRTPRADEQLAIAQAQHARIEQAAATHAIVVCDTTSLMTAVYSRLLFGDRSLEAWAVQAHARASLTLLTALDLPWVADGLQRDGPHVQEPVDEALRALLQGHALPWVRVAGQGPARLAAALAAVRPLLSSAATSPAGGRPPA
jgi:nicotinamide riboside kinase